MKFSVIADSLVGSRINNQDRVLYLYNQSALLLVLADGMGGHLHGELAAQVTIDSLSNAFEQLATPIVAKPELFLKDAFLEAHQSILDLALSRRFPEIPCTTVVAALIQDGKLYWSWVGDSRFYLMYAGSVLLKSKDHSLAQKWVDEAHVPSEQESLLASRIYSCLGLPDRLPDIGVGESMPLEEGQVILLCSDGLWSQMTDRELALAFESDRLEERTQLVLRAAEKRAQGRSDNLSAVVCRWWGDFTPKDVPSLVDTNTISDPVDILFATMESERLAQKR